MSMTDKTNLKRIYTIITEPMYITYDTAQYCLGGEHFLFYSRNHPIKSLPHTIPRRDFIPTKLVRTSDMTVTDGTQVNEGYCVLSYSWNQSGEIVMEETTGKHKRIDEEKHEIISNEAACKTSIKKRIVDYLRKRGTEDSVKYVKFEGIIQQICQQFNIKYIWYDQMCINQNDKDEKHREIRNMHHIYSNAFCTVALVPDYKYSIVYNTFVELDTSYQYFKRLWTLEELLKSERVLFVGKDKHVWGMDIEYSSDIYELIQPISKLSVSQILRHAHQRTSTKDHDRVFALIHLFPDIIDKITIDYDQPLEGLMIRFYGLLGKKDISILCFRKIDDVTDYNSTIQKYKFLPSWTGVNGQHREKITSSTSFQNYDIVGKTMRITSEYITNYQPIDDDSLIVREEDLPPLPDGVEYGYDEDYYKLCISVRLPGTSETRILTLSGVYIEYANVEYATSCNQISRHLKLLSRFMEVKKENLFCCSSGSDDYQMSKQINLSGLTESVDDPSAQYMILSEISFTKEHDCDCYYPVVKKEYGEEHYKAIGCCLINCIDFFFNCKLPKQAFLIQ